MKKLLCLLLSFGLMFSSNIYAASQWDKSDPAGSESPGDLDSLITANNDAIDRMLSEYREGCKITYASASTVTVGAGQIMLSNSTDTIRLMQSNASAITVTWSMIDTGSEAASKIYYLWAFQETVTDSDFEVCLSLSSSAPSGKTYYKKLGSIYNNSAGHITRINDDSERFAYGAWVAKSNNVQYQAMTDGEFIGVVSAGASPSGGRILAYTGESSASSIRNAASVHVNTGSSYETAYQNYDGFSVSVKAGDYYKGVLAYSGNACSATYYWQPKQ